MEVDKKRCFILISQLIGNRRTLGENTTISAAQLHNHSTFCPLLDQLHAALSLLTTLQAFPTRWLLRLCCVGLLQLLLKTARPMLSVDASSRQAARIGWGGCYCHCSTV